MLIRLHRRVPITLGLIGLAAWSCQPTRDLDATTRGTPPEPEVRAGAPSGGGSVAGSGGGESGGRAGSGGASTGGTEPTAGSGGTTPAGSGGSTGGTEPGSAGGGTDTSAGGDGAAGADSVEDPPLGELPNELDGSPVQGTLTLSESTVAGQKVFQIVSPLASFTITASNGIITQLEDRSGGNVVQWVSPGARRPRRAGIVATPQPTMTTVLDEDSFTARHVRLRCASDTGAWEWSWDFYPTQATLSLTKAGGAYAFTFSGTPGDQLTNTDNVVPDSGAGQSAIGSFLADLAGPAEWAYLTDAIYGHSLFLIQHQDDELMERYDAIGGDTATWVFGNGGATRAQRRFSIGFLASAVHANVTRRVQFVIDAMP
jgi:hypothetical protein